MNRIHQWVRGRWGVPAVSGLLIVASWVVDRAGADAVLMGQWWLDAAEHATGSPVFTVADALMLAAAIVAPSAATVPPGARAFVTSAVSARSSVYQPLDSDLTAIAALTPTDSHLIVGNGTTFVAETGATARASLGLGDSATKNVGTAAGTVAAGDSLVTETDNRVLYDEELARAVTYATDLAGQAATTLSGSVPRAVPARATAPGVAGQLRYASGFLYVCVASNVWQRVALATWS